jgi:quinoprotein glucose dehydrogenase
MIRAFDKDTGEELWSAKLPWAGCAPPSVYEVNGREFVVIAATGGGKIDTPTGDAYVAFALPGDGRAAATSPSPGSSSAAGSGMQAP